MKPFSITAPEEIAKEYGGDKRKIQQAASQGLIDPTSAVLAGMFIDRIRGAAAAEQAPQTTVAEQVLNPQPQMPSAGLAATPQAAQMQQPMAPQMPQPGAPRMPQPAPPQMAQAPQMPPQQPMGMAMGGGLDAIPYYEGRYAPGGLVSFNEAGSVQDQMMAQSQDQMMAQSRALIEALQRSRDPAERRAIQDRLRQLNSAMSVAPPGLVTEPLGPQAGDDRAGLANMDMLRQMEADATAQANAPVVPSVDLGMGMENFANTQRPVNPYDPEGRIGFEGNRFDTGTMTEEEAMRIEGGQDVADKKGLFGAVPFLESPLGSLFTDEGRVALARSLGTGGVEPAGRNVKVGADESSTQGATSEGGGDSASFLERLANFRGLDDKGMTLREKVSDPGRYFLEETAFGRPFRGGEPTPDAYTGATMPAAQTTDAANQFVEQPEDDQFGTIANQIAAEQEAAQETPPAAGAETETRPSFSDDFNALQEQMKGIMPQTEYGEYRKKFEQMMKDSKGTMERGRKDAFSMALLQAGLGMLGQQGGQTALQALGKAALPATKQYMDTIKDLKKEDQELFKLGLSLEKMDAQERNATLRTMTSLVGQQRAADLQYKAALLNAEKTTGEERMITNDFLPAVKEKYPDMSPAQQRLMAANMFFEAKGAPALAGVGQRTTATDISARETALDRTENAIGYGGTNRQEYRTILREQGEDAAERYKERIFQQQLRMLTGGAGSAGGGNAGQSGGSGLSQEDQALVNQYLQ